MTRTLPPCVPCARDRLTHVQRRARAADHGVPAAAYLVTVGRSQVERFECAACQAETGNPIRYVIPAPGDEEA